MPETKPAKKADTKLLIISWALGIALVIGYTFYWFIMAHQIEEHLMAARNDRISFSSVKVSGYPYRFTFIAKDIKWKYNPNSQFHTEEISATASTLEPQLWVLEGMNPPSIWVDDKFISNLQPKNFKASLRFKNSQIERLSIMFDEIIGSGRWNDNEFSSKAGQIHFIRDELKNEYAYSIEINKIQNLDLAYIPLKNLEKITLRGLIFEKNIFTVGIDNFASQRGKLNVKYGEFDDGLFSFHDFTGDLAFNDNKGLDGQLSGKLDIKTCRGNFGPLDATIYLKNTNIDVTETTKSLLGQRDFNNYLQFQYSGVTC